MTSNTSTGHLAQVLAGLPRFTQDPAELELVRTDRSGYVPPTLPDGVVRAESVQDVVRTLTLANEHRIPVVPRGAGTGLAAGSSACRGEIVLDLRRMNRILRIDPVEQIAVVEPGVLNADLNAAAGEYGLFYAPDPASTAICSIGGNIATNAGGMRCAKYGVTRESVLSLTVVLADGRVLVTGTQTIKAVTGYDMNALFIGSEGTLGVVVEATLRLRPAPVATATVAAYFRDVAAAAAAASAVVAARATPSVLELVDGPTLGAIDLATGTDHRRRGEAFLLAQTDGFGAEIERDVVLRAIEPFADAVLIAKDPVEAEALVQARRDAIPSLEKLGRTSIGDVGVPRHRLAEIVTGIQQIAQDTGVDIYTVAHAADGNLHPMIVVAEHEPITEGAPKDALGRMFELARSLGGTLTGEHGVGLLKQDWFTAEVGQVSRDLQHRIKRAFDPHNILNPGKAI
ncbi:FAD-binding protein [Kocuria sediminis]|uniref:FAD-binding protein n=1 Tax=Kocuria sediminis TaxID=1038857 RepID=A0A6N8GMP6_9MICC|nr:FAD-linked oxidase C-terminal domain-containing protein [Kocuria sediminis]MUN64406.1 FAD-binding protein [Kocuria sediminis]